MAGINFQHDREALAEIQRGAALACDLEILAVELEKFFDQNQDYFSCQFLHYSYDENTDGIIGKQFIVSETR